MTFEQKKRPATAAETQQALRENCDRWNRMNPSFEHDLAYWETKQAEAEAEGYQTEVCSCGTVFLAFHHLCGCRVKDCPMKTGASLLHSLREI